MIFKRKAPEHHAQKAKGLLVWLEIGVTDFNRAAAFYKSILNVSIEERLLFGQKLGIFKGENLGIGICIIEKQEINPNSVKPTFFVNVIHETLAKVVSCGGKVISEPALLKQQNANGETLIGANLIDDQIGYMAEIQDTEENFILLYSHH